jgi:hypothetical protein
MPKSDEFKFQARAAPKAEREQRHESGNHRDHAHHGTVVARKSLAVLDTSEFCAWTTMGEMRTARIKLYQAGPAARPRPRPRGISGTRTHLVALPLR